MNSGHRHQQTSTLHPKRSDAAPGDLAQPATRERRRKHIVNAPLLWGSMLAAAALAAGGYAWHSRQVGRNAAGLLEKADAHEQAGEWAEAVRALRQFSRMRTDDSAAKVRLARAFEHVAETPAAKRQALSLYAAATAAAPANEEIRSRHLELLLEAGDPNTALSRAEEVLRMSPGDVGALRVAALAIHEQYRIKAERSAERVREALVAANRADPSDASVAARLARFYRLSLKQPEEAERRRLADGVMDALLESSERKVEAHISRYAYRMEFQLPGADDELQQAIAADVEKTDPAVAVAAARAAMQEKRWNDARSHLKRAIDLRPERSEAYLLLGQVDQREGGASHALLTWQRGLDATGGDDLDLKAQIAEVEIQLGRYSDAANLLDQMEKQVGWLFGPEQTSWLSVLYALRADAALAERHYSAAIPVLKRILSLRQGEAVSETKASSDARVYAQLGECYSKLRAWDRSAESYQRAADLQPRRVESRLAAGGLWEQAGWLEEAARQYEQAATAAPEKSAPWLALADVSLRRQLLLPPAARDWRRFNEVLAAVQRLEPNAVPALLLAAESAYAQDRPDQAAALFEAAEAGALESANYSSRLALDYERIGRHEKADSLVAKMQAKFGETAEFALLRARLLVRRQREAEAISILETALSRAADFERDALRRQLSQLRAARDAFQPARADLARMSAESPDDPRPIQLLIELDLQAGRFRGARTETDRLRALEESRDDGSWPYYLAQTLIAESQQEEEPEVRQRLIDDAGRYGQELESARPRWAPAYLLKARLALLRTKPDENKAIQAYAQSLRLGERRLAVYEELISLLFKQNRIAEADVYLEQVREMERLSPALAAWAVAADVWEGNVRRATETARRDLSNRPQDPLAHLRLGQLLAMSVGGEPPAPERLAEAELELNRARDLAPNDPRGWSALLAFYRRAGQEGRARELLAEVERTEALEDADRPFFLAQGYALLGDRETASGHFHRAVDVASDRPVVLIQAAQFFWRSAPDRAERYLRRAIECQPGQATAKRLLAAFLAARGRGQQDLDEAWQLIEHDAAGADWDAADRRLQAMLHLQQGGSESREQARQAMQAIVTDASQATAADHLLLAKLYEAQNQLDKAREQFAVLADSEQTDPACLATYIDYLIRTSRDDRNTLEQVGKLLDRFSTLEPEATSFRSFALRTRWLGRLGRESEAPDLGRQLIASQAATMDPAALAELHVRVAGVYASLNLIAEAEAAYRRAVEIEPPRYSQLAAWLAAQGRGDEAVELCLDRAKDDPSARPAIALAAALATAKSPPENQGRAEELLGQALKRFANEPELLFAVAALRSMWGDNQQAIDLLRLNLKRAPHDAATLNNLAMILCETPDGADEALKCIEVALEAVGRQPELLDTKGWVLLRRQRHDQAESAFRDALFSAPGNPKYRFHLAISLQEQGKGADAREALDQAKRDGLDDELLSPAEQAELVRLAGARLGAMQDR